jgi:hypothetical protein
MVGMGGLHGTNLCILQYASEVNILCFELWRICIGNVTGEHFHALASHSQGLLMHTKSAIYHVHAFILSPLITIAGLPTPSSIYKSFVVYLANRVPCFFAALYDTIPSGDTQQVLGKAAKF